MKKIIALNEELITVKTFFYNTETLLYEHQFKEAGIYYYLKDQNTISIDPLVSPPPLPQASRLWFLLFSNQA